MKLNKTKITLIGFACFFAGCGSPESDKKKEKNYERSYEIGATAGFCELVNYGVKRLGLGVPMTPEEMDIFLPYAEKVAESHNVKLYREPDLIDTDLFTAGIAKGKDVLLIYNGATLIQYLDLKEDRKSLEENGEYSGKAREEIARRFGRLLSYTPKTINNQLALHTDFRTMEDFGIQASNVVFYYENLEKAVGFYSDILGLEVVSDQGTAKVIQLADKSFLTLVDASIGTDYVNEPKTVAMALVTDQVDKWYAYLKKQDVEIKHSFNPKEGRPYHSFVMADPEGYLIEFERFNQHPQNEKFIPEMKQNTLIYPKTDSGEELSINSSITWLYYKDLLKMQIFYEDVLGLEMICDQGWVKIYQSSETGFIGLVDEKRGMHNFTETKAVKVSFMLDDLEGWYEYTKLNNPFKLDKEISNDSFVGVDPEGYHMQFSLDAN